MKPASTMLILALPFKTSARAINNTINESNIHGGGNKAIYAKGVIDQTIFILFTVGFST